MKNLNLGCGSDIKDGWINIDKIKSKGVDKVLNLDKYPYPFEDNSIDKIQATHILEHIKDFTECFKELTRILKIGGKMYIKVPHFSNATSNFELHKTKFFYRSFGCKTILDEKHYENEEMYFKYFKVEFRKLNFYKKWCFPWNYIVEPIINLNKYIALFWEYSGLCSILPAKELEVIIRRY